MVTCSTAIGCACSRSPAEIGPAPLAGAMGRVMGCITRRTTAGRRGLSVAAWRRRAHSGRLTNGRIACEIVYGADEMKATR
jgi:hypothetical protein